MTYSPEERARRTQRERERRARLRPAMLAARASRRSPCAACGGVVPNDKQSNALYCSAGCSDAEKAARLRNSPERRERATERARQWRADNPERSRDAIRAWRAANPHKEAEYQRAYRARHHERLIAEEKAWREANRDKVYAQNHRPGAAEKRRVAAAELRRTDPERVRQRGAEQESRRRSRIRGIAEIEKIDRAAIIARDRSRCHLCGKRVAKRELALDHLIPVALGGPHTAANLAVAHRSCNGRKWIKASNEQLRLVG